MPGMSGHYFDFNKYSMRIEELKEGVSSILYHYTSMNNIAEILKDNVIRLTPDMGTSAEVDQRIKNKIYYLSTARSMTSGYFAPISEHQKQAGILVLDGQALMAAGFSGKAMDYWGPEMRKLGKDEMEDRIFSAKSTIPNANKFIKEVHILLKYESGSNDYNKHGRKVKNLMYRARQLNIPVYLYNDHKSFGTLFKQKAVSIKDLNPDSDKIALPGVDMGDDYYPPYSGTGRNYFAPYIEMLNVNDEEKLSKNARNELYNLHYSDKAASISADIHNARTGRNRAYLDKFLAQMKKYRISTVQGLIDHLNKKFNQ